MRKIILVFFVLASQVYFSYSKGCIKDIYYSQNGTSNKYTVPIDTTVSSTAALSDPFTLFIGGGCGTYGGGCYYSYTVSYFNRSQILLNSILPQGVNATLVDTFYYDNGCGGQSYLVAIMTVHITTTGISENIFTSGLNIYPNPVPHGTDYFIIRFNAVVKNLQIEIYNLFGETILKEIILNKSLNEIYLKNISSGIYFVKIKTDEGMHVAKLIKE